MSYFDKFDEIYNTEEIAKQSEEVGEFEEVPPGEYAVSVDRCYLNESKTGKPMVTIWFKITEGEFENQLIFCNQVIEQGFQVHVANEILRGLAGDLDIHFESFGQFDNLIQEVADYASDKEYDLKYGKNKKGFASFMIVDEL